MLIPQFSSSMDYGLFFAVGVLTSVHYVAMCGEINLSQGIYSEKTENRSGSKFTLNLLYNLGRVISVQRVLSSASLLS